MKGLVAIALFAAVFSVAVPLAGRAQTYDLSWHVIGGGGGTSSNGNYTLSGTIGQADAGQMSNGNYALTGGFWGVIAAVQTPGSPLLTVQLSFPNIIISWPAASTGFTLQAEGDLLSASWSTVGQSIVVTNGFNTVTMPISGNQYFRLTQ